MANISLLDCTLRDGGYVNKWNFKERYIKFIIASLFKTNIEVIECGYLDHSKDTDYDKTRYSSLEQFNNLVNGIVKDKKEFQKLFLMVDYKKDLKFNIPNRDSIDNWLDGIRVVFHKEDFRGAIKYTEEIIKKGYKVCIQPMATSTYSDKELTELLGLVSKLNIYAFYIVDSFGSMTNIDIRRLFYLINNNLNNDVRIGLHTHNNLQLAFSNVIDFLDINRNRDTIIDSSVFGMGRGAGNLNTELISDYLNKNYNKKYNISPMLQVIDDYLDAVHKENYWGFSVGHYLSGSKGCHPNYASFLVNKKTLSISSINEILDQLTNEDKIIFNKKLINDLYFKFLNKNRSQLMFNNELFLNANDILVLGSGISVKDEEEKILNYIEFNKPLVLSLNHIPNKINADFIFFTNQKRYDEFIEKITDSKSVIISSNVTCLANLEHMVVEHKQLLNNNLNIDNVAIHFIQLMINIGRTNLSIAGLDGYSDQLNNNYSYNEYNRITSFKEAKEQNEMIANAISVLAKSIKIKFVTKSMFENEIPLKVLGIIPARYKSSRFEGKPLALIDGTPMIERTYNQAKKAMKLNEVVVATDDIRIAKYCESRDIPFIITSESCLTGTDRVAEVSKKLIYDLYVNIQGDEPVISPEVIDKLVEEFERNRNDFLVFNCYKEIFDNEEVNSNTIIKTIVNENNELVYMSRRAIPFSKIKEDPIYHKQVCVYGFTKEALDIFSNNIKTINEKYEDIEILRFLDLGIKVKMIETDYDSIAVDVPEDIKKVEEFLMVKSYD